MCCGPSPRLACSRWAWVASDEARSPSQTGVSHSGLHETAHAHSIVGGMVPPRVPLFALFFSPQTLFTFRAMILSRDLPANNLPRPPLSCADSAMPSAPCAAGRPTRTRWNRPRVGHETTAPLPSVAVASSNLSNFSERAKLIAGSNISAKDQRSLRRSRSAPPTAPHRWKGPSQ